MLAGVTADNANENTSLLQPSHLHTPDGVLQAPDPTVCTLTHLKSATFDDIQLGSCQAGLALLNEDLSCSHSPRPSVLHHLGLCCWLKAVKQKQFAQGFLQRHKQDMQQGISWQIEDGS
jgi:hypothetical protein